MDKLVCEAPDVIEWIKEKSGSIKTAHYKQALQRSVIVEFSGNFSDALVFLQMEGVRRALIAYWTEYLIRLNERGAESVWKKSHNWNAVAEIRRRIVNLGATPITDKNK